MSYAFGCWTIYFNSHAYSESDKAHTYVDTKGITERQEMLSKTSAVHLKYIYCGNVVDSRCNAERLEFPGVGGVFFWAWPYMWCVEHHLSWGQHCHWLRLKKMASVLKDTNERWEPFRAWLWEPISLRKNSNNWMFLLGAFPLWILERMMVMVRGDTWSCLWLQLRHLIDYGGKMGFKFRENG